MSKKSFWFSALLLLLGAFGLYWFRPHASEKPLLLISTGQDTRVESIAFPPDSKKLAIGVSTWRWNGRHRMLTGGVQVRDAHTGYLIQTLPLQSFGYGPPVDFSPDGETLAVGAGKIKLWNVQTQQWKSFPKGSPQGYWVIYSPDGKTLATGSADNSEGTAGLWDTLSGKRLQMLKGHTKRAVSAAFSPDGTTLATASYDNTVKLWDVKTGALKRTLTGRPGHMMACVAFAADGKTIASGDGMEIRLWDAQTGQLLRTLTPPNRVFSVAFSPNGQTLASAGPYFHGIKNRGRGPHGELLVPREHISAGEIRLWETETGRLLKTFRSGHWALDTVFAPDGKTLVNISDDDTIRIWSMK